MKVRRYWNINPKTRVKESKKKYSRPRQKKKVRKEIEEVVQDENKTGSSQG